jgi:phosphatidylglycerol---prolipoprotein diacylglyceryl transferase
MNTVDYFYWNPSRFVFSWNIPFLGRPILWYGVWFVLGFFCSYLAVSPLLRKDDSEFVRNNSKKIAEKVLVYAIIGTVIGARIFHMVFYEKWVGFFAIIRIWDGGLSSHGGVIGMFVSLYLFQRRYKYFSYLHLLDLVAVVSAVGAGFIRIGNFFNQEILGKPSSLPWSVIFGSPVDGSFPIPRHPVQLYEAFFYWSLFVLLKFLYKPRGKEGFICGLYLILVFVFRFLIEFLKEEQSCHVLPLPLNMGQFLSLPFILLGFFFLFRKNITLKDKF